MVSLNVALEQLQRARITPQYGEPPEGEMRLRPGALRLGRGSSGGSRR